MCDDGRPRVGRIGWTDLTVRDAETIRDFYANVVGWSPEAVDMGSYSDFNMTLPDDGSPAAGICHARGTNAELPAQWLVYITVQDLDESMSSCEERGGKIVVSPKDMGTMGRYCVIQDPAGAVAALYEPSEIRASAGHGHEHDHHHHEHEGGCAHARPTSDS
jgi:hypothetical protein